MLNTHFNLIRYLFVLEVNSSLIWLPKWPAMELSLILGETIADRLPIVEARAWKKTLAAWNASGPDAKLDNGKIKIVDRTPWPIDAVIFWYPAKRSYGKGEKILFELKLLGDAADHELFIEVILPAMEQIAMTPCSGAKHNNPLWGHFDIRSVYSARGNLWKPLLRNGRLDLRRTVNSTQWSKELKFKSDSSKSLNLLTWLSPFMILGHKKDNGGSGRKNIILAPKLSSILEAVAERMSTITLGKYSTAEKFLNSLDQDERLSWNEAMSQAANIRIYRNDIEKSSDLISGLSKGSQSFATKIPDLVIPYLGLGSIIHIGEYTHFGCGTYVMV